jgi:AcrR family transcriptional regulator
LRATALEIVGRDGIDGVTFERLGAQAQMPPEIVQAHYPTVAACLYDTYEKVAYSIYKDFATGFAAVPGWRNALRHVGATLLRRMAANPAEARLCFAEILQGDYELLRRREASRRRLISLFVRELGKRRDRPEDFRMQLELLIGSTFQAIASAVAEDRLDEFEQLASELESRAFVFEPVAA